MFASESICDFPKVLECFASLVSDKVCFNAVNITISDLLADDAKRPAAAFCLAWLQVAGGNSVLPPWVRYRFPEISSIIQALRENPCGDDQCKYCSQNHDPEKQLTRFFGYPSFRMAPKTEEGESLQRSIVLECMGIHHRPFEP